MGRLTSLTKEDIKMANSLGRVLALLELNEDDLLLLKEIKSLKEENKELKKEVDICKQRLEYILQRRNEAVDYLSPQDGEHLNDE